MEANTKIPFLRSSNDLPGPLPTSSQIRESPTIIHGVDPYADKRVVIVGPYVVKYGKGVSLLEGQNLLFIEENFPQVPAPKLYAMWRDAEEVFLVMEQIQGQTLDTLWPTLGDEDKVIILNKLRDIFESLHSPPGQGFFGSVLKGPIPYHLFWDSDGDPTITGPFEAASDMIYGLAKRSRANSALNHKDPYLAEFFERNLAPALDDRSATFCHSDVQRKNIIIENLPTHLTGFENVRVVLLDWEVAGWYPSYWEYVAAFIAFIWDDDWPKRVEDFLPIYGSEAAQSARAGDAGQLLTGLLKCARCRNWRKERQEMWAGSRPVLNVKGVLGDNKLVVRAAHMMMRRGLLQQSQAVPATAPNVPGEDAARAIRGGPRDVENDRGE